MDYAKEKKHTVVIKLLENDPAYLAAQVGHAAPRRAAISSAYPHPSLERGTERSVPIRPHPCGRSPTIPYLLYVRMLFIIALVQAVT